MGSKRSTTKVDDLTVTVNHMIAASPDEDKQARIALSVLIETVLMDTGNYHGFRYADGNAGKTDDTRRVYFTSSR